jgi:hypothetical protein
MNTLAYILLLVAVIWIILVLATHLPLWLLALILLLALLAFLP